VRGRAREYSFTYDTKLEDFVLRCREEGASVRSIADSLGVGSSTVQQWTQNARRRREDPSS